MKTSFRRVIWCLLIIGGGLFLPLGVRGQQEVILHNFGDGSVTNDGYDANAGLIQGSDGNFYGATSLGGSAGVGTIFKITPQGQGTILHVFGDGSVADDGDGPLALIQGSDGNFYGTTLLGGSYRGGTVFKMTPQGAETILHSFDTALGSIDGISPAAGLIQGSDGNFYGTTYDGGSYGGGTVFKIPPVTVLLSFVTGAQANGQGPAAGLIQGSDGNFYGTTEYGGSDDNGTVFKITPQGQETILHRFLDGSVTNDGANPQASLIQGIDGNFYGTTVAGGSADDGTVFKITPQGTVTILHSFGDGGVTNDGANPYSPLIQGLDGNFYGTTDSGGYAGLGTAFKMTPQGTVTILHSFGDGSVTNDGTQPRAGLTQGSDGNFYGTTPYGGSVGDGTVFKLEPGPPNITSALSATAYVALPFNYQVTGTYSPTAFAATNLPNGLSINPVTGLISGTATTPGTANVTLTLTNAAGSNSFPLSLTVSPLPLPVVTSILTAYGAVGASFTYQTVSINNTTGYFASGLSGTGLAIDPSSGIISGTPTSPGTYSVTLTSTNAAGTSAPVTLVIKIFATAPTLSQEYNLMVTTLNLPKTILQGFDGNFYGVSENGGSSGEGAFYEMTVQGVVSILYSFTGVVPNPTSLVQAANGTFYGTTASGQIFTVTLAGQFLLIHSFGASYGAVSNLIQGADGNFYGTTAAGGTANQGTVFAMTPLGIVTFLHNFGDGTVSPDGNDPLAGLIQGSDGNFYGTTKLGGAASTGTVYKITPEGAVTILHSFSGAPGDGAQPEAAVLQGSDGNFYGTTAAGGTANAGTVFQLTPPGTVTILHNFGDQSVTNDGTLPAAPLIEGYDGNYYGTTTTGGAANEGAIFQITPQGNVAIIHSFGDGSVSQDGSTPTTPLIQSFAGNFYGVTSLGGTGGGTVYSIIPTQSPTQVPIFTGAAYASGPLYYPISYTPKAIFGFSGTGADVGPGVQFVKAALSPQLVRKTFSTTNWTLSGNLPNYLSFDPTSGTISGTPVQPGTFTVTMTPSNAVGLGASQTVTIYVNVPPGINSALSVTATVGVPFSYQIETTPPAQSYGATDLTGWLTVDPIAGVISGTPPAGGSYYFNAVAVNVSGQAVQPVNLTVTGGSSAAPTMANALTASGTVGQSFSYTIPATNNPTSYTALSLPAALIFNAATGEITGLPTVSGTFTIPVTATNASGTYASTLTLTIAPASTAPGVPFGGYSVGANGAYYSPWFGFYNNTYYPFIYRYDLGYLYVYTNDDANYYLYVFNGNGGVPMGWIYTSQAFFPFVYDFTDDDFLYFFPGGTTFYNFGTNQYETY